MTELHFDATHLKNLFREIGLSSSRDHVYESRRRKHRQVFDYIKQIESALSKLSTKRPIVMLDCGCGKSYLSFMLYEYCQNVLGRQVKIIGVDNNPELICQCNEAAQALSFSNMEFYSSDVGDFKTDDTVDIIYSLHACNTATDQMIAKGIEFNVKYIFSVSCCQHRNRALIEKHPLKKVTRFQPYKERLVDMIGDSMRALLLEHVGYSANIYEFVPAEFTPKNIMLRGVKGAVKKQEQESALDEYKKLVEIFHFAPALEEMITVVTGEL